MAQIPKRSPRTTTQAVRKVGGQANPKHTEMYAKQMTITLTGANPAHIQAVAAAINSTWADHTHVKGGKAKRLVTVTYRSTDPTKIFDGCVRPDGV